MRVIGHSVHKCGQFLDLLNNYYFLKTGYISRIWYMYCVASNFFQG
jgi:hypothetical protein